MKSESGFGLAMASPFHFGTESCYIFDFFLLAISLTTIFQHGRSSIFGKCNHYFLGRHRAQQHGDAAHGLLNLLCLHHLGRGVPPQRQVLLQPSSCLPPSPPPTVLKYVHNPITGLSSCAPAAWTLMLSSIWKEMSRTMISWE